MSSIQGFSIVGGVDLYTSNTQPSGAYVGQYSPGAQGKGFRYVKAGASALVVGNVIQAPAIDTQFNDLVVVSGAANQNIISVTNGTTTFSAGALLGSTVVVSVTPGLGQEFTVTGNTAGTNGGNVLLTVDRPIRTALTTSSRVTLRRNPYDGVIQAPATTLTGSIVGVAIYAIAAGEYGWIQTKGVAGVLSDGSSITATNQTVCGGSGTAGACTLQVAGLPVVGRAMQAAASGKCIPVDLLID